MESGLTIRQTIRQAATRLAKAEIDTAMLDAEVLMRHVLDVDRTHLFLRYPDPIADTDRDAFERLIVRRLDGAPVAYLTSTREFMGLPFHVAPGVLIPRPDTEPLVEWALDWLADRPDASIVDIGTGSGAIAISLAAHLPASFAGTITATDTSADALAVARQNVGTLLPPERSRQIDVVQGSLTTPIRMPVDLVLANLPYLTPEQIAENPDLDAEPRLALDGGTDGLDLVRAVIADLPRILTPTGATGFEIDPSQADAVATLLATSLPDASITIIPDLARLSRHVAASRS